MDKFSSCCGVPMNGAAQDYQRCPECKESCDAVGEEVEPIEYVKIEMLRFKWDAIKEYLQLIPEIDYNLKEVKVKDGYFDNDETAKDLQKKSYKAYKDWQEYMFKKRNNIKK